jgi:hypothetical protein
MKVSFRQPKNHQNESVIELSLIDNHSIQIESSNYNFSDRNNISELSYIMPKEELRDFIGALLHLQSKLK